MFGLILNLIRYVKEKDQLKSLPINNITEDIKNCAPVSVIKTKNEIQVPNLGRMKEKESGEGGGWQRLGREKRENI